MAKNSTAVYGAVGKSNVLFFEPEALTIIDDPKHPLYDERIHLPLKESMVLNIMTLGVREPILVWKDPEIGKTIVVDGRGRVRHALEANRRLAAAGEPLLQIPGVAQRGTSESMADLMISMNEARHADTPMARARKMATFQGRGYSDDRLAIIFACGIQTVRQTLSLLDCTQTVQDAVETGQIGITRAKSLAKLEPDAQREKVAELIKAGEGVKPHERARRQREVLGETRGRMRSRKEIEAKLQTVDGPFAAALSWVLNREALGSSQEEAA